jgi:hypothetical protein
MVLACAQQIVALYPTASIPSLEMDALKDLFYATSGSNWFIFGVQWNFTQMSHNPCVERWQGISRSLRRRLYMDE